MARDEFRRHQERLLADGWRPVGYGKVPAGHEVCYGPLEFDPGFVGRRSSVYIGRWCRPINQK